MSVKPGHEINPKDRQHHPTQQLLKNVLTRLDMLQNRQIKPFLSSLTSNHDKISIEEIDKIKVNMKIVLNSSIENLRRLEDSTKENWNQVMDRLRNQETRIMKIFKEKQEAMEFLELRIVSVENSQKAVTEFMKKVAEQENYKYSGVPLLEERMKQIQHIFQLKDKKQSESLKIVEETTKFQTQKKFKELEGKMNSKIQESQVKKQSPQTNVEEQLQEMADKIRLLEMQSKEQKRKISKLQQALKEAEEEISSICKKTDTIQRQLKNFERSEVTSFQGKNVGFKTQNAEKQKKLENGGYHTTTMKKTEPNYLKPEPPSIHKTSQLDSRRDPYDILPRNRERLDTNDIFDKNRKNSYKEEVQDEPFQNMGAGIRGLLRKSKEKEEKKPTPNKQYENTRKPLPRQSKLTQLSRQPSPRAPKNRNLPPVKADQKLQNKFSNKNSQITSEQDEQVYQVDEQGYLMDQYGNYLEDEEGNRIQLSEQEMNNMMEEN